jgi:hypothetical protein
MTIIEATEIIATLAMSDKVPPTTFKDSLIQKAELILAAQYLGDDFYQQILDSKTAKGTFDDANIQTLYDTRLKQLIAECVFLSVSVETAFIYAAIGAVQRSEDNAQALSGADIERYKENLNAKVELSKMLCTRYLVKNSSLFPLFLENNTTSQQPKPTDRGLFLGFLTDND